MKNIQHGNRFRRSFKYIPLVLSWWALPFYSCSGIPEFPAMIDGDWDAPILTHASAQSTQQIALAFDEQVSLRRAHVQPAVEILNVHWNGKELLLTTSDTLTPGARYWIDAEVEDTAGNISSLLVSVYGFNPFLPKVVINEVVCEASGKRHDWVELAVLEDGNMGGMTLYEGTPETWESAYTFAELEVVAGDFITVHFDPERIPEEIDESTDRAESGGESANDAAWDVWVAQGDGIPNSTGALTLTPYPEGPIIDAFLYSTKRYEANHPRRGFGTAGQVQIFEEVVAAEEWLITGEKVIPEDAFDPSDSTATRSINRGDPTIDTNTSADWHIGPTSSASPGAPNTREVYR